MKKIIVSALFLLSASVFAAPYEMYISQLNGSGNDYIGLKIQEGSGNGLMFYSSATHTPSWVNLGGGLSVTSGNLNVNFPAQTNVDWNSVSGVSQILNKPDLSQYVTTSTLTSGLAGKLNTPSGTTLQYIRGDGTLATFPTDGIVVYNSSGVAQTTAKIVKGACALSLGQCTVNFSGNAVFTSQSSYNCTSNDVSGLAVVTSAVPQSGSQIKAFGTGSNTIQYTCIGN